MMPHTLVRSWCDEGGGSPRKQQTPVSELDNELAELRRLPRRRRPLVGAQEESPTTRLLILLMSVGVAFQGVTDGCR